MKQRYLIAFNILLLIGLVGLYVLHFKGSSQKIAYVDSGKLLGGYQAMIDARKEFQQKSQGWQSNIDTLVSEVQQSLKKYNKEVTSLSPREKQLSEQMIKTKQGQLENYQKSLQQTAQQEELRLTQGVISQANAFIERYGKEHNYKLILVATQAGNIAYAEKGMDITEEILQQLNKDYAPPKK